MGSFSRGITGASVMMLTVSPALYSVPGVVKLLWRSSALLLLPRVGPTNTGSPSLASSSAISSPSVQWSRVAFTPNSLAIRTAVRMSSARWAWHFRGISPLITGSMASSFMSKGGFFPVSLSSR